MQEMIYQAPQGYPLPECLCYNTADLRMLTEFYSGRASELTTTMQYSYQNTVLHRCRPEIAEALGKINMVEMRHLSLLGPCIALMGGDIQQHAGGIAAFGRNQHGYQLLMSIVTPFHTIFK